MLRRRVIDWTEHWWLLACGHLKRRVIDDGGRDFAQRTSKRCRDCERGKPQRNETEGQTALDIAQDKTYKRMLMEREP